MRLRRAALQSVSVLTVLIPTILLSSMLAPARARRESVPRPAPFSETFDDFESGSFAGWTVTGEAFGDKPATSTLFSGGIRGFVGKGFAATLHPSRGSATTGKAISRSFVITRPMITFKIGGGSHPDKACLNLVVDDQTVRSETGDDSPQLITRTWDVADLIGKTAHLEIVDETNSAERGYILVDDIQLTGGEMPVTPGLGETAPMIEIPLRVVHVLDAQGKAEFSDRSSAVLTPSAVQKKIDVINEMYQATRIRFTFDAKDFETRRDDYLNLDSDPPAAGTKVTDRDSKPKATGTWEHLRAFEEVGAERPDRLTILVHRGSEWWWDERSQKWIFAVGFSRGGNGIQPNGRGTIRVSATENSVWAHELGHALGLPHISKDGVDIPSNITSEAEIGRVCGQYLARGGNPVHPEYAIDGDYHVGIRDTPPDPGVRFWGTSRELSRVVQVTIPGREPFPLFVSRNNVMAPKTAVGGFTNDQVAVMRRTAEWWKEMTSIQESGLVL
jgi:hypothetical protein